MAKLTNFLRRRQGNVSDGDPSPGGAPLVEVEWQIPNLVCEGCAEKLDDALHAIDGIREIRTDVRKKRIRVRYEPTRVHLQQLKDAVASAGFTTVEPE